MKKMIASLLFMFTASTAFAAGPIVHVYLAELWVQSHVVYSPQQTSDFIVGTLFPDIRYYAKVKREVTHKKNVTLQQIVEAPNAFEGGLTLHCYVDEQRDALVRKWEINNHLQAVAEGKHLDSFLKLVEDEIMYEKIDLASTLNYLHTVPPEELKYGISHDKILGWHMILGVLLSQRPSEILALLAESNQSYLHIPKETVQLWHTHFKEIVEKPEIKKYVEDLVAHFSADFAVVTTQ